jgi:hypothetical protein
VEEKMNKKLIIGIVMMLMLVLSASIAMSGSDNTNATINIVNTPPVLLVNPAINDTSPGTDDAILCYSGTYYDINSDPKGGEEFKWYENGVEVPGQTTNTLDLTLPNFDRGDQFKCANRVNDSIDWSTWYNSSNTATVDNALPTIDNVTLLPIPLLATGAATCTWNYSDLDNDTQANTLISWYVDGVVIEQDIYNDGDSWPTLASTKFYGLQTVNCTVTVSDGLNYGQTGSDQQVSVNNPPYFAGITFTTDPSQKEDILVCSALGAGDLDGGPLTAYYVFYDSDNTTILQGPSTTRTFDCGANANCLKGDEIMCSAFISDNAAVNSSTQNATISIINTIPEVTDVYVNPTLPFTTENLTCNYNFSDVDPGDTEVATYIRWFKDGVVTSFTGLEIDSDNTTDNEVWRCEVTVYDGEENSTPVNSTQVTIGGDNPSNIIFQSWEIIDEGDSITFLWTWDDRQLPSGNYNHYVCGTNSITQDGCAVGETLCTTATNTSPASCTYTPPSSKPYDNTAYLRVYDDTNLSSPIETAKWYLNHYPIADNATINVTSNGYSNTFTCDLLNVTDEEAFDDLSVYYSFYQSNGTLLQEETGTPTYIVQTGPGVTGDSIECRARVSDDRVYSDYYNASNHFVVRSANIPSPVIVNEETTLEFDFLNNGSNSSAEVSFRNPFFVLFTGLPLNYTGTYWERSFSPNIVGTWTVYSVFANSTNGQSYAYKPVSETFVVEEEEEEGGGGGGGVQIREVTQPVNLTGFCGDNICQDDENPLSCSEDCRINYDTLFTCIWDDEIQCNWEQTWFALFLIIFLIMVAAISIYRFEANKKK